MHEAKSTCLTLPYRIVEGLELGIAYYISRLRTVSKHLYASFVD